MSDLYLKRIDLENFRTFGRFRLDLPPAPGLTLLVGTNGLGKSSFFDALEWGLTGQIRRFASYLSSSISEADYLTRRDAPENSHKVSLAFTDGKPLVRTAKRGPKSAAVIDLLKKPDWGAKIEDISTYLAFTHFLGQAAQQRFTSRDRSEQWESLKGPSGIDRLEEVRRALRGRSTQGAFRRRLEQQEDDIERIRGQLVAWQASRVRLQRLRQAADATGSLSGAALEARISDLATRLRNLVADEVEASVDDSGSTSQRLISILDGIAAAQKVVSKRATALEGLSVVAERYVAVRVAADPGSAALALARQASEAARTALESAEQAVRAAQATSRQHAADVSVLNGEVSLLTAVRVDVERIAALDAQQAALAAESASREHSLVERRQELSTLQGTIERSRAQRAELAALNATLSVAKAVVERCRQLADLEATEAVRAVAAERTATQAEPARAREAELIGERNRIFAALQAAERKVQVARTRASQLAAAIAQIANHLGPHEDRCPVCSTNFKPGDLKLLAEQAAVGQSAELAAAEAEHAGLSVEHARIDQDIASTMAVIELADVARAQANEAREAAEAMRQQVRAELNAAVGDDLAALAAAKEAAASAAVATLNGLIAAEAGALATAVERSSDMSTQIVDQERRLRELSERNAAIERERRAARERLATQGRGDSTSGALTQELAERNALLSAAQDQLRVSEAQVAAAALEANATRQRAEAAEADLARQIAAMETAARDAAALERQWTEAGLIGAPMISVLDQARAALARRLSDLTQLSKEQATLAASNNAAIQHQELADLVRLMEQEGGEGSADQPDLYEAQLQSKLSEVMAALKRTDATRSAINAFSDRLKKEAEDFSIQFLAPLNDLIDDFNRALLSSPGESIRFNAAHHVDTTRFDMRLTFRDRLDEALYNTELPPQIVLSEGQLAANGFSILCAASTAYPWSRWRALLLDDPLQHNDIIHAAAFVDVMRNLVELEGYQLIVSSHDRSEGEFFARKFDAAGLPCTIVALSAPSKNGVRFEAPRHNAPARAHMREALTQSG